MMHMYTELGFVRSLFDRIVGELLIPWIRRLKEEFPNAMSMSENDAYGSFPIVELGILKEWIVPYIMRLREA